MSTVANATGTMGMDEDHIIDADIKKLDTQSQQVQILLRILAILKGKPGTDDAKDIEKVIKEERAQLPESTQDNTEISETSEEGGETPKEKTRSEKFQEDINGVADRIREAGGLRAYTKNAIKGSMSRAWNRSALKHGIDTVTGVARGIGNVAKGTATATLGLSKYLLNRGKDNLNGVVKKGKKAGSFLGGLLFGKRGESEEENDEGSKKKKGLFSKITGSIGKLGRKFSAQDDLEENENTIIDIDKGVTAEERQQQMKEEKEASVLNAIRESTETQVTEQKGFTKLWSSIFSKKGLITGSLILAAPFIFKAIKKIKEGGLWNFISDGLKNIGSFITEKVGPFFKEHIEPLLLTGLEKLGGVIGNAISSILPDWANNLFGFGGSSSKTKAEKDTVNPVASALGYKTKSGRMQWGVLDEQGNWDNESGARLKLGTKVAVKGATIIPGLKSTLGKNVAKSGWIKGTAKTAKQTLTKKGRKEISKNGSNALIKKGNQKFKNGMNELLHGGTANIADDVANEAVTDIPIPTNINLADDATKLASSEVDDSMLFFGETAEEYLKKTGGKATLTSGGDDIAKAVIANSSDDVTKEVAERAAKNSMGDVVESASKGLKSKVVNAISKFADDAVKLIEKKIGKSLGETGIGKIVSKVTQCATKHFSKISAKISAIVSAETGLAATGVGWLAKNGVFCTLSAINGVSGTARLFQVDKENIDWVMTTISGALGFFNGTMVGSICDVVNELVVSIIGIDFYTSIASLAYKAIMSLTGNKDKAEALNVAQDEFKGKYEDYTNEEAKTSLDNAKKLGLVDSNMSLEEYKATYTKAGSDYKSFADYNDEQHKTIGSRIMGGLSTAGHKMVSPFMNEETITVTDENGNTYVKNKDGTYTAKDSNGKEIGTVSGTLVESLENTTTDTSTKLGVFGKIANTKPLRAIGNFNVKVGKGVGHFFAGHEEDAFQASDGTYYTTDGKHYNQLGYNLGDSVTTEELQEMLNNGYISGPVKFKVASGYTNMGASIGRGISNFGNSVASGTKTVISGVKQGFSNFGENVANFGNSVAGGTKTVIGGVKQGFSNFGSNLVSGTKTTFSNAKESIGNALNNFKEGAVDTATKIKDKAIYYANPLNVLADIIRDVRPVVQKISDGWNNLKDGAVKFTTETVPNFFNDVKEKVGTFFTETIPNFANGIKEKATEIKDRAITFVTETIPNFFTNVKEKAIEIKDKAITFVSETVPNFFKGIGEKVGTFFTKTIPGFFTLVKEKVVDFATGVKDKITTFATETVPNFLYRILLMELKKKL